MAKKTPPPASIQALTAEATLMKRLQGLPEEELKDILETMWGNAKIEYATMPDGNTGVKVYTGTSTQHDPADLKGARLFSPSESAANAHAEKYGGKTRVTSEVIPMMSAVSGAKVQSGVGEKFGYGYEIELNKQGQVVTPTNRSTKEIGLLSGTTPTIAQKFAPPPASSTQTMQEFMASKGIDRMQSGTRDAYYHSDGTVRNAAGDLLDERMPKTVPSDAVPAEMSAKSKAMRSGLTDLETGKTSRFYKPGLGMLGVGLGAALAPDEAWAAPFSEEGLNYWGGAATGLDLGKAAADPSRLSPFSIGATLAEDTISGLGQMIGSGLDTSQVGIDLEPDYGMAGGIDRFGRTRAGPDIPAGYDLSAQVPGLAGTQTGMPVAVDAGGAVGGYPTMDADYGTMATEEFDYVPSVPADPTGGMIDADALAGMFDVGPMSMAQVGTNAFGIPDKSYGKVSKTYSELLADTAASKEMNTSVDKMINKLGNTGMLDGTAQEYGYSHPFQTAWYDHPYMSSEDAMFSQGMKQKMDQQDSILGGLAYSALQPVDEGTKLATSLAEKLGFDLGAIPVIGDYINRVDDDGNVLQPASLAGTVAQMAFPMAGVQQDNIPALVDDIVASRVHGITSANRPNFDTGALADPNISVQATQEEADAKAAEYMAAAADTQDMMMAGGLLGGGTAPLPAVSAPMAPRQQAMPAVTTPQALSTQDERQQAMPEVSVPAPTAPTTAAVAAQARLDQQLADAAMRRAAQAAAAQDAARQAAQRAAVQADIAAAQAEQDMVRRANRIMSSKDYMDAGIGGLTGAQLDVLAAANIDTFAGANRQVRGDRDSGGYSASGMGQQGGYGHPGMR